MRGSLPLAALLLVPLATGCYDTAEVAGGEARTVQAFAGPAHDAPFVLQTAGGPVHVGPRSRVRFHLVDGGLTSWVHVADLSANADGIAVLGPPVLDMRSAIANGTSRAATGPERIPWSDVRSVEVEDLDDPETFAAGVITTAVVAALVAAGGGNLGSLSGCCSSGSATPPEPPPEVTLDDRAGSSVFTSDADRRGLVTAVVDDHAGMLGGPGRAFANTVGAGVELDELWDLEVTYTRLVPFAAPSLMSSQGALQGTQSVASAGVPAPSAPSSVGGFGARAAMDLAIDPWRRVFIPVGFDAGELTSDTGWHAPYAALDAEVDFRVVDPFRLGVRPFNPEWIGGPHPSVGLLSAMTLSARY